MRFRKKVLPSTLALMIFTLSGCTQANVNANSSNGNSRPLQTQKELEPISETVDYLRELLVDLASYHVCGQLNGRIMGISPEGAHEYGGESPIIGTMWIDRCRTNKLDSRQLEIEIEAIGWKWVEREIGAVGATFELDQNVKFDVIIKTAGTFDIVYDPNLNILTIYFVPLQPVEAVFNVTSVMDVETRSLWSSIVGEAAPLFGETLSERAIEQFGVQSSHAVEAKLKHGLTIIVDLCTSRHYTKFGSYEAGKLPEKAAAEDKYFEINTPATLNKNSMLMAGPFKTGETFFAKFENTSSNQFEALWMCQRDAKEVANAYIDGKELDFGNTLKKQSIEGNQTTTFYPPADIDCELVLVMRSIENSEPISYNFAVIYPDRQITPLVECNN